MTRSFIVSLGFLLAFGAAQASSQRCEAVPREQWQPVEALTQKLQAAGWKVLKTKTEKGCYEVYAVDAKGVRMEAYYHPKTLEPVAR